MDRSFRPRTGLAVGHGPVDRPDRPLELRTFAVPEDQLTAARSWVAYGERRPRAARRASSVAVVRDGLHGVETLLRHRGGRQDPPRCRGSARGGVYAVCSCVSRLLS